MILTHFVFALFIAFLLVILFGGYYRRDDSWAGFLTAFFLILFASWAGGLWLVPVGPVLWGVSWLPFVVMGFLFALLLAALSGGPHLRSHPWRGEAVRSTREVTETQAAISALVWVLFLVLFLSIVARYLWVTTP